METANFRGTHRWKKRSSFHTPRSALLTILLFSFFILLFFYSRRFVSPSSLPISRNSPPFFHHRCGSSAREKFLWYAPHSGFSNQLSEFRNALLMASILNRTLIVPPVLDHHAVALGSCPKFRVLSPTDLRFAVWNHSLELLRDCRYVSMADIVDLSVIVSASEVNVLDFRVFVSEWCGVNLDDFCTRNQNAQSSLLQQRLNECGSLLSGKYGNVDSCLYALDEDCRTTVWTYQKEGEEGALDSFQPNEELKKKKKIAFVRRRRDVYKTLGPGSVAESAKVIAFGSLFTSPYKGSESHIDIHEAPNDKRIDSFIKRTEFLPFVPEILGAGKTYALQKIRAPFLCAQLRLLDGQFKNHWKTTFQELKHKLESLKQTGPNRVNMFLMTDLPIANWTGSYLDDITKDSGIKLFVLKEDDELVIQTARNIVKAGHGMKYGSVSKNSIKIRENLHAQALPDVLLFIEETICSCASLGFVGTSGSTIAKSIELMRKFNVCNG